MLKLRDLFGKSQNIITTCILVGNVIHHIHNKVNAIPTQLTTLNGVFHTFRIFRIKVFQIDQNFVFIIICYNFWYSTFPSVI